MPENGRHNGYNMHNGETNGLAETSLAEGETFLFTSESVGEGHPGKWMKLKYTNIFFNKTQLLCFNLSVLSDIYYNELTNSKALYIRRIETL